MSLSKELVERVARALYGREVARGLNAHNVLSAVAQKPVSGILAEPWEECRETFMSDARAALSASGIEDAVNALGPFAQAAEAVDAQHEKHGDASDDSDLDFITDLKCGDLRRARTVRDKLRGQP